MYRVPPLPLSALFIGVTCATPGTALLAQEAASDLDCDFSDVPGVVWWGPRYQMTVEELVSYIAPVYWFSPDEQLLYGPRGARTRTPQSGASIRLPEVIPFEEPSPDRPVVYYQVEEIVSGTGAPVPGLTRNEEDNGRSVVDFRAAGALKISFFAYFSDEWGLGAHLHDLEAVEFRIAVPRTGEGDTPGVTAAQCDETNYTLMVTTVTAKAHGIIWFWNVIDVDEQTKFPMHLLVEEGKHGLATDKNSDGVYTPGYDVSRHINDAWGVRDIISTGTLFRGGFEAWMAKDRRPEHRVYPPLPDDSQARADFAATGAYELPHVEYSLRPLPAAELALTSPGIPEPEGLYRFMADKEKPGWPEEKSADDPEWDEWFREGELVRSFGIALRLDGDVGVSFTFPLLIVKNFEDPLTGGFVVNRIYLKNHSPTDFGWQLLYTPSASRWLDGYLAAGLEVATYDIEQAPGDSIPPGASLTETRTDFTLETGIKFRGQISGSPLGFLSFLTDFWGVRMGIQNKGFFDIDRFTYVIEIGAGVW